MRYLADTHVLLWAWQEPERLSRRARTILEDASGVVFFSTATIWEMAIKISRGKLRLKAPLHDFVADQIEEQMKLLPIRVAHAVAVSSLPQHHGDPFDRMLIAQAQVEELNILTADPAFARYRVGTVW